MIKVSVSYAVNGRTVPKSRFASEVMKELKEKATVITARRIQSIHCPIHGQTPKLRTGLNGEYRVQGCCDQIIDQVRRQLR